MTAADNEGIVAVRRAGGLFRVACEPADPSYPPQDFADMRAAWGCAGGIKIATGRRKVDLTGTQTKSSTTEGGQTI